MSEPEIILVEKATNGLRPVPILPLTQRVLYRGLTNLLKPNLPPLNRSKEAFSTFITAPTSLEGVEFVVVSDVAACYQFVDHSLVEEEIVNQTGEAGVARELSELLIAITGRRFGLPQNHDPSHLLAEQVLDAVHRRLLRAGLRVWRYNDDFRLGAGTWNEAQLALEQLERHLQAVGLTLNDEKTTIKNKAGYLKSLQDPEERWKKVQQTVAGELATFDPYTETVDLPEDADVTSAAAIAVLDEWKENVESGVKRSGYEAQQDRQVLMNAIWSLQILNDPEGLAYCKALINEESSITPRVCRYMEAVAKENTDAVVQIIDSCLEDSDSYISGWQALWLLQSISGETNLSTGQVEWANQLIARNPTRAIAAQAALALAYFGAIQEPLIAQLYNSVPEGSRPEVVAALASLVGTGTSQVLSSVIRDAPENNWISEHYRLPF